MDYFFKVITTSPWIDRDKGMTTGKIRRRKGNCPYMECTRQREPDQLAVFLAYRAVRSTKITLL